MTVLSRPVLFFGLILFCGLTIFVVTSVKAGPCAAVKAGTVDFMDSPECRAECAVDGGDCPYGPERSKVTTAPEELPVVAPITTDQVTPQEPTPAQ